VTHRLDPASVPADGNDGLITIADASGMTDGSTTIAYTGLEPVLDAMPAVDRVFTFTAGAESVTLSTPGDGSLANKIDSTLSEATSFNNPAGSLTVNLTNDSDTLDVQSLNVPLPGIALTINGDGGDTVNFTTGTTNIGAGNANVGTTVGQPIQTINFNGGTLQTSGDVFLTAAGAIQTSDATLDVMADDLVANAGTGIDLDTTVATIVAAVSGDGAIQIDETDGVTLTSVTTANGPITVNAGGQITAVLVGSGGGAGDGVRLYTTAGDIVVGVITSADTASLETVSGSIVDHADDTATDITAAALITLTATADIHGPGPGDDRLDLAAGSLVDASSETAGAIRLRGVGSLGLQDVDTANGPIDVLAAGQITATDVRSLTDADANDIILRTTGGNIVVGLVSAGTAAGDVWLNTPAAIEEDGTADGTADIVGQDVELVAGTGIGDAGQFQIDAVNLAAATTTGDINLHDTAGGLTIASLNVDGIGSPTDGVSLTGGSVGDDITIRASDAVAASPLTVNAPVSNSGGGDIRLAAEGNLATDDLTVNANVTATGGNGNIWLYAGDSISLAATVTVGAAGTGAVLLSAGSDYNNGAPQDGNSGGDVSMASGAAVSSEDGNITVLAPNDVQLSIVNANSDGDAVLGDVIVTADYEGPTVGGTYSSNNVGAISDSLTGVAPNGEAPNIVGDQAALRAGSGIGSGVAGDVNDIDTAVRTLAARTESGNINIQDIGTGLTIDTFDGLSGLTITDALTTDSGDDITIVTRAGLTVAASNPITNNDGGDITLRAEGGGGYALINDIARNFADGPDSGGRRLLQHGRRLRQLDEHLVLHQDGIERRDADASGPVRL